MVQEFRTPDIYIERVPRDRGHRLEKVRLDVVGFLGFTSRGPIGTPTRITSWESFQDTFGGFAPNCFLPQSVFGFFINGGEVCHIIRIASVEGPDAVAVASTTLQDTYGRPTLKVAARDAGAWGNSIKVCVIEASTPPRARLRANVEIGANELPVDLTRGFEPGAAVRISDGERTENAVVDRIDRRHLVLRSEVKAAFAASRAIIEGIEVQVQLAMRDQFEIHDNLALLAGHPRSLVHRINESSRLVRFEDLASSTPSPFNLPTLDAEQSLRGGRDGLAGVRAEDFIGWDRGPEDRAGLHAFENVEEIGSICAPDLTSAPGMLLADRAKRATVPEASSKKSVLAPERHREEHEVEAVQRAMVTFCEHTKTSFALLDPPPWLNVEGVLEWRMRFDTTYAACYWPWLRVLDPVTKVLKVVPPCGHVAGLYARSDREHGVHKAPANDVLHDVIALNVDVTRAAIDRLALEGVNCIRSLPGRGIRVWGARTLSSNKLWEHVNVRRVFIMVERSIAEGTEWAVFETNNWPLWKAVERNISSFLTGIWREGMLLGAVPEQAFFVRCDETTNPPESREVGEFACDIGIAVVRPAEFIVFRIGQRTDNIITEEPVS